MRAQTCAAPARRVVPIRMRHKLVPQPRAQVRPHLPGEPRAWVGSLVGDAGEAVVGVAGESVELGESGMGAPGGGVAHRGSLLEFDADAAARSLFDGLYGLVAEVVVQGGSTSGLLVMATKRWFVKNELGPPVNAARLEYTHGTMLGDTTTTRGRVPVKSAISGGRALKQQRVPGLRFSGGWTTRG